ncbi:LysR family transcriptional regulator [Paenibacillus filicis]|uniref:LysR family transcriptional regulator n=1 Tax=Paenibacillus filicis TaxID=669464 RepID=A0ABU9DCY8_9BACL
MDFLQLRYFQRLAQLEHMTKAANELHVSQPSLSQSLARLEDELGFPLFARNGRVIRLNDSGKAFLVRVDRLFAELEAGKREAAQLAGVDRASVSFGAIHLESVPGLLGAYMADHPHTSFSLHYGCNRTMVPALQRGELDLFISSPLVEKEGLITVPLYEERLVLYVPHGHRLANQRKVALREAASEAFIGLQEGSGLREASDDFCGRAGFAPHLSLEIADPTRLAELVDAGIGVALIPGTLLSDAQLNSPRALDVYDPEPIRRIGLTWVGSQPLSPAAESFRQRLITHFTA